MLHPSVKHALEQREARFVPLIQRGSTAPMSGTHAVVKSTLKIHDGLIATKRIAQMGSFTLLAVLGSGSSRLSCHHRLPLAAYQAGSILVIWDYTRLGEDSRKFILLQPGQSCSHLFFSKDAEHLLGFWRCNGRPMLAVWRTSNGMKVAEHNLSDVAAASPIWVDYHRETEHLVILHGVSVVSASVFFTDESLSLRPVAMGSLGTAESKLLAVRLINDARHFAVAEADAVHFWSYAGPRSVPQQVLRVDLPKPLRGFEVEGRLAYLLPEQGKLQVMNFQGERVQVAQTSLQPSSFDAKGGTVCVGCEDGSLMLSRNPCPDRWKTWPCPAQLSLDGIPPGIMWLTLAANEDYACVCFEDATHGVIHLSSGQYVALRAGHVGGIGNISMAPLLRAPVSLAGRMLDMERILRTKALAFLSVGDQRRCPLNRRGLGCIAWPKQGPPARGFLERLPDLPLKGFESLPVAGSSGLTGRASFTTAVFHPTACLGSDGSLTGAYAMIAGAEDGSIHLLQEATADAEQRWAEEALAEVQAAEDLAMEEVAMAEAREDLWMAEADMTDEAWMEPDHSDFVDRFYRGGKLVAAGHKPTRRSFSVLVKDVADFNDWGSDPFGAAKAAARAMTLTWQKSWEIPKMPLGTAELQDLFGFELAALEAENLSNDMHFAHFSSSNGQVNRIRCGQLGQQSVVVAVDAAGGVLVAPSQVDSKLPPLKLLNVAHGMEQGTSTWGIGLPPPEDGRDDAGPLLVSANDHWLKAWWPSSTSSSSSSSSRGAWQLQQAKGRTADAGHCWGHGDGLSLRPLFEGSFLWFNLDKSPIPVWHFGENLPSIDVLHKRAIVASLGGEVSVLNLLPPSHLDPAVPETPADFELQRVWNVCWIPLRSIRTVSSEPPLGGSMNENTMEWTARPSGSAELLQRVQILNRQHAHLAQEQVLSSKRTEQMALIFSENTVWLTEPWQDDGCLNMRCKLTLPFNGAFAHVVHMPRQSAVIVSTKMGSPTYPLAAVTVLRRQRSLRFELRAVETDFRDLGWPRNIIVGMAAVEDRLFILYSSCRLVCHHLALENRPQRSTDHGPQATEQATTGTQTDLVADYE
eukprot:s691_g14.t1